jgi:VWFA-related protein
MKFVFLMALLSVTSALAQTPPSPAQQSPVLAVRTTLVLVPALVRTKAGAPVFTLKDRDFVLTDDGIEQAATVEEDTGSEPLALVIAVQTGGAGGRHLDKYRNLGTLIEAVVGGVPRRVAVVEFDSVPRLAQGFTSDLNVVGEVLGGLEPGDRGGAILDGLAFSVDLLRTQPAAYRRAVLLVSETVDHGSQARLDQALHAVSDTNTAIYSLAFSSAKSMVKNQSAHMFESSTPGPAGGCMAKDPNADPGENRWEQAYECLSLLAPPLRAAKMAAILAMDGFERNVPQSVAELTGGEYFKFTDARSLDREVVELSHHLPNRYVLSFHPVAPHAGFHAVGLKLRDRPELVVTGRNGYWADSERALAPGR